MEPFIYLILTAVTILVLPVFLKYSQSDYKNVSGHNFVKTLFNRGNYGEFLTFYQLEKLKGYNKLITNVYIPKENDTTTEIDLMMVSETGIYVFESKNYSGWIFGSENQKEWTQSLPNKVKNKFYNPIWQNRGHISALKSFLEIENDRLLKSYIIFSERCTLKKISVTSENIKVIKRNNLMSTINQDIKTSQKLLSTQEIDRIFSTLKKHSLVDDAIKRKHIDSIQERN